MATIYDAAGDVVATGLTVLRESNLTQRRTDVVHDPLAGGLPLVVRKTASGLAGNLELLCPTAAMADDVYAAHKDGAYLRLDDWQRQNLTPDPRLTTAAWSQAGSTGILTHATSAGPNGHGYFEYAMDTANTTSPMQVPLAPSGLSGIPVVSGEPVTVSSHWWQSLNQNIQRYDAQWYTAAGTFLSNSSGADLITPTDPPSTWYRESSVFTPPVGAAFLRPIMSWSGTYTAPQTLRVADALVEYGTELGDYFDGGTPGTDTLVNEWSGTANASVSNQYIRPALALTYAPVGGVVLPVKSSSYWRVSVPGIQEVSA